MGRYKNISLTAEQSRLGACTISYNERHLFITDNNGKAVYEEGVNSRDIGAKLATDIIEYLSVGEHPNMNVNVNTKGAELFKSKFVEISGVVDDVVFLKATRKTKGPNVFRVYGKSSGRPSGIKLAPRLSEFLGENMRYLINRTGNTIKLSPIGGISFNTLNARFDEPVLTNHVA